MSMTEELPFCLGTKPQIAGCNVWFLVDANTKMASPLFGFGVGTQWVVIGGDEAVVLGASRFSRATGFGVRLAKGAW
jgi:hypothetical protein